MPRVESWDISEATRALLKERGWSQKRLADEARINREDINRMLASDPAKRLKCGRPRAERIAAALGVTVLDLGLPPEEAGEEGKTVLTLLAELQATVSDLEAANRAMLQRIAALEQAAPVRGRQRAGGRSARGAKPG